MGLRCLRRFVLGTLMLFLSLAYSPFFLDLQPEAFSTFPPERIGALAPNDLLEKVELLYVDQVYIPECLEAADGYLYTGLDDGRLVRLKDGKMEDVVKIGDPGCEKENNCGRPLGMKFDSQGFLVIADPKKGLYKVNVKTGEVTNLFSIETPVDGVYAKVPNHLDVSKDGHVYFSDVSTKRDMFSNYYEFIEVAANGRILHYDPTTKKTSTLIDGLYFPNGIQLSPDEDFFVFAQSSKYNLMKYHLKGPKKNQIEPFVANLPGVPDNLHTSGRGTFWVALAGVRFPGDVSLMENLGPYPLTRKILGRIIHIVSCVTSQLEKILPLPPLKVLNQMIEAWKLDLFLGRHVGYVLEVDWKGEIVRTLQSPSGKIIHISHALEYQGHLYLGSPFHPVIGKLKL